MHGPRVRVALLVRKGSRILLIQQKKDNRSYWLLPGGGLNYGERLSDAIEREMEEELGLRVTRVGDLVWACDTIAPDGSRHLVNLCFEGETVGEPRLGDEENLTGVGYFGADELTGMDIRPPLNRELVAYLAGEQCSGLYLGALWKD